MANSRHQRNIDRYQKTWQQASFVLEDADKKKLAIVKTFGEFSDLIETIQNRPEFAAYDNEGVILPKFNAITLKKISLMPGDFLGQLDSKSASGQAGAFLGDGHTSIVFSGSLSKKPDEAWSHMKRAEDGIDKSCVYLEDLKSFGSKFLDSLNTVNDLYLRHLVQLKQIIFYEHRSNWNTYSDGEKLGIENCVLLAGLLYKMCQVKLALKDSEEHFFANKNGIDGICGDAEKVLRNIKS
jgi:hypothetical protein